MELRKGDLRETGLSKRKLLFWWRRKRGLSHLDKGKRRGERGPREGNKNVKRGLPWRKSHRRRGEEPTKISMTDFHTPDRQGVNYLLGGEKGGEKRACHRKKGREGLERQAAARGDLRFCVNKGRRGG